VVRWIDVIKVSGVRKQMTEDRKQKTDDKSESLGLLAVPIH
jgi:hypothetical protein